MLIFDRRICPESLSIEFGYTLYNLEESRQLGKSGTYHRSKSTKQTGTIENNSGIIVSDVKHKLDQSSIKTGTI
jgi:hypothetical protein